MWSNFQVYVSRRAAVASAENREIEQIQVIYIDFKRAFDKVPHKRLICKQTSYGINNDTVD